MAWPLYELSLFTCPLYIISILTGGQSWSLPWVLLLFIHDQNELQGYFFFQRVHCTAPSLLLMLPLWISRQRWRSCLFHFWSQACSESTKAEQSKEKQCGSLSRSNLSYWHWKTPSLFFSTGLYIIYRNHWHKLNLLSMKLPFKLCWGDQNQQIQL